MKVRTKISLVLLVCAGAFLILNAAYYAIESKGLKKLFAEESRERTESFGSILTLTEASLKTFAYDYTFWDDMVSFVSSGDKAWADANIGVSLKTYSAIAAWVCRLDGSLVYGVSALSDGRLAELPMPRSALDKLFATSKFCHFFVKTPEGLIEIRGATIHGSLDVERKGKPFGYFFAGRLWDQAYVDALSRASAARISVRYGALSADTPASDPKKGMIAFGETLRGWDGAAIADIDIVTESPSTRIYFTSMRQSFVMFLAYSAVIFLTVFFALVILIWNPLRLVSRALRTDDVSRIQGLADRPDEFGEIAGLVRQFFSQRQVLVETEKMSALGRFAGGAAHEIKNPLAIIYGSIEYLQAKLRDTDPDNKKAMDSSIEAVQRASAIVDALTRFGDTPRFSAVCIGLDDLVEDALEAFMSHVREPNVRIEFLPDAAGATARIDPEQVRLAFTNILANAVEAVSGDGSVTVRTRADMPFGSHGRLRCAIEVADTGSGISSEDLPKVFEPFFTTKRDLKQLGLGLTIAQAFISANNGTVAISSKKGKGTVVTIEFPLA